MIHVFRIRRNAGLWLPDEAAQPLHLSAAVAVPFLIGVLLGCVVGLFSDGFPPAFLPLWFFAETGACDSLAAALWQAGRYVLVAALLSSSALGVVLLPGLALLRGFVFSGAVAALYAAGHYAGLAYAALAVGIPGLIGVAAFLTAACCGLRLSRRLIAALRISAETGRSRPLRLRYGLLIAALVLLQAVYSLWILPLLLHTEAMI